MQFRSLIPVTHRALCDLNAKSENCSYDGAKASTEFVCNFIKKESLGQVFSCEFCEIF